jgi:soluble lytic murein transglycosylase-like protein
MRRLHILIVLAALLAALLPAMADAARYRVQWGDTLSGIAASHGISLRQLARNNGIRPNGVLLAGTVLRVPGGHARGGSGPSGWSGRYTVRWGNTLSGIALMHGTTLARLAHANGLAPYGILVTGTVLRVPGRAAAPRPTSAAGSSGGIGDGCTTVRCALDHWAAYYGVSASLVRAMAWQESGWNPRAVSSAGARGVMQVMPHTRYWVDRYLIGGHAPWTPSGNIRVGVAYLQNLLQTFGGNERLAVAAYYQGPIGVAHRRFFPSTRRYVANVLALRGRV